MTFTNSFGGRRERGRRIDLSGREGPAIRRNDHGGVRNREAQPCVRRIGCFTSAGIAVGNHLALARYGRHRTHRRPCRGHVLVRPAIIADVSRVPLYAPPRTWLLARIGGSVCPHGGTVRPDDSYCSPFWCSALRRAERCTANARWSIWRSVRYRSMDKQQHDDFLGKIQHAEGQAIASKDQTIPEGWLKIAASYRGLVNRDWRN
jgi:hypothetical protein